MNLYVSLLFLAAVSCAGTGDLIRARELASAGRHEAALAEYYSALEENPKNHELHFNIGILLEKIDRLDPAIAHFRKAREAGGDERETFAAEARCAARLGNYRVATELRRKITELAPRDATAWTELAASFLEAGDPENARTAFEKALLLDKKSPDALLGLGRIYDEKLKDAVRALSHYDQFLEVGGSHPAAETIRLRRRELVMTRPSLVDEARGISARDRAQELFDEGLYQEAARVLSDAHIDDAGALFLLGRSWILSNELGRGVPLLERAVQAAPGEVEYWIELVRVLRIVGDRTRAGQFLAEGQRRFPEAQF